MRRILLIALLLVRVPVAHGEQRVALVIGNGAYKDSPLRNPPNDARAIAQALRGCGFQVIEKINSDQQEMEKAIREFGIQIQKGGVGLFYYAGHGIQLQGTNYLIPVGAVVNAEHEVKYEAVDAGRVLSEMEAAGNRVNIVILDACRNNPFTRSFRSVDRGLKKMDSPKGSILAYATAPGNVAADGEGQNGLYTSKLLLHMKTPGLPVEQVFKQVRADVMKATGESQVPWESTSLSGDFYFVLGSAESKIGIPRSSVTQKDTTNTKSAESTGLTDDAIRQLMIAQSIASYSGSCPCPYNTDRAGRRCGKRSAWSRPGGASPLCYTSDISDEAVASYRASHK